MIALLQRVAQASVVVNEKLIAHIGPGTLAMIGVEQGDGPAQADRLLQRVLNWRMFEDDNGRMNLSLANVSGGLLLVPQFTLAADTRSGNRPSFSSAAAASESNRLFAWLVEAARNRHSPVATGAFGADMKVSLVNDGPVTFWLQVNPS